MTTVDDFVSAHDVRAVDLVKIDTEATEDSVLAGMTQTLARDRPAVVCEILPGGPATAVRRSSGLWSTSSISSPTTGPDGAPASPRTAGGVTSFSGRACIAGPRRILDNRFFPE